MEREDGSDGMPGEHALALATRVIQNTEKQYLVAAVAHARYHPDGPVRTALSFDIGQPAGYDAKRRERAADGGAWRYGAEETR